MLDKYYSPQANENNIYTQWEQSGCFAQQQYDSNKENFCIMMPPPNITGNLHMGHALNYTLQDILTRYHRMNGKNVLWQPGTDHAGIATQMLVEKSLKKQGITKNDLGREKFLATVREWKQRYGEQIVQQQRKLGLSPIWDRQKFTMDSDLSRAVQEAFFLLYQDDLIYQDKLLIHWDTDLQTAVSDLEVNNIEQKGHLWYIKYFHKKDNKKAIIVATTRPETLFGDTAIAVHPEDERYKNLIGDTVIVPFVNREIPIIADEYCEPTKGSGAVKITPSHDFNDFEVGKRHQLEQITVIDSYGKMEQIVPKEFAGLDRFAARKLVVQQLEMQEQLVKTEEKMIAVPYGDRSNTVLEPRLTNQWFLNVEQMAKTGLQVVQSNEIDITPENNISIYNHWLKNIQPWCISRQLWWGHRIPAWYSTDGTMFVAKDEEHALELAYKHFGEKVTLRQDNDVLDTWFSSALWPFATLGWPAQSPELERFYPNNCLITGSDILFFWVARMIMLGTYFMKKIPFRNVFLNSLVLDNKGQKMSKTKGNVINPLDIIEQYGADALRFTMASLTSPNRNIKFAEKNVEVYRNFTTKLWNLAKFIEANNITYDDQFDINSITLDVNKWIVSSLVSCIKECDNAIAKYRFDDMSHALYQFTWRSLCDWYVEFIKPLLYDDNNSHKVEIKKTLGWIFGKLLHILHPTMPFITELLWKNLNNHNHSSMLINAKYPSYDSLKSHFNEQLEYNFTWIINLITTIRSTRNDLNIPASAALPMYIETKDNNIKSIIHNCAVMIKKSARIQCIDFAEQFTQQGFVQATVHGANFYLKIDGIINIAEEKSRIQKNIANVEKEIKMLGKKLSNEKFINNAPEEIVHKNKTRLLQEQEIKYNLTTALTKLK